MRIQTVEITNFKTLRQLRLENLPPLVVIAGPNGSGKTALFEALRLFKEAFATYSIQTRGPAWAHHLLQQIGPVITVGQDRATITATFEISGHERTVLQLPDEHSGILTGTVTIARQAGDPPEQILAQHSDSDLQHLRSLFGDAYHSESGLGVIDHIGPDRRVAPMSVSAIQFSQEYAERELRRLVYESATKFENLYEDLVLMHFTDLQERDQALLDPHDYIDGVQAIFRHFLPDKEFVGVELDRYMRRPPQIRVRGGGVEHDVRHLSSGEREILMTYSHLEKLRPSGSVVLFDEPELHLHPALQRRVIAHLQRLIERGENQIWVITHSEEIVGSTDLESLYQMTGQGDPAAVPASDQAARIRLLRELGASIGLQLSSPRILFVEGESDEIILELFFDPLPAGLAFVATGGKGKLMRLTESAMQLLRAAIIEGQFYCVRDRDIEDDPGALDELELQYAGHFFTWDRYHIENYLLDEDAIYDVLVGDPDVPSPGSTADVLSDLKSLADERRDDVLAKRLEAELNRTVRRRIVLNSAEGLRHSLSKAAERRLQQGTDILSEAALERLYTETESRLAKEWEQEWKSLCVGRDVLMAYHTARVRPHLGYDAFRNRVARKIRAMKRIAPTVSNVMDQVTTGLPKESAEAGHVVTSQ